MNRCDILIAGGGLAGLTAALEMARHDFFRDKTIFILDRDEKQRNDRTWCFWATPDEPLPPVVHRQWSQCFFYGNHFERPLAMGAYRYYMVRGLDFYQWAHAELAKHPNIRFVRTRMTGLHAQGGIVDTEAGSFSARWVLNSAFSPVALVPEAPGLWSGAPFSAVAATAPDAGKYTFLLQHFKGWIIRTEKPVFNPDQATLMDFRVAQHEDTRFVYVLPFSATEALVEYTVFSPALLDDAAYDQALELYIREMLDIKAYTREETEFGIIPMTDYPLINYNEGRTIHIGTAGGFVKGSSGYAFKRTQRKTRAFIADWAKKGTPDPELLASRWRYRFYDSIMLRVLRERRVAGKDFFTDLFQKLPAPLVFRFLDEDSTFAEDRQLLGAPPTRPFFKTALRQIPVYRHL